MTWYDADEGFVQEIALNHVHKTSLPSCHGESGIGVILYLYNYEEVSIKTIDGSSWHLEKLLYPDKQQLLAMHNADKHVNYRAFFQVCARLRPL